MAAVWSDCLLIFNPPMATKRMATDNCIAKIKTINYVNLSAKCFNQKYEKYFGFANF